MANLKVLNWLTALASTPSLSSSAVQPLYWKTLSSKNPRPEGSQLSAFLFKPGETKSPGLRWGSLGAEMPLSLRSKHVPVQQRGQFVLVSPATESLAGIKELYPHLETEGQDFLRAHNSDQPQLVLISHS